MNKSDRSREAWGRAPSYQAYLSYMEGYESAEPVSQTTGSRFPSAGGQELQYWRHKGYQDAKTDLDAAERAAEAICNAHNRELAGKGE